jgi:hypothetical protein
MQVYGGQYPGLQVIAFTEGHLYRADDGKEYFITSPVTLDAAGHQVNTGCVVIPFWNIATASLARYQGSPWVEKFIGTAQQTGACTYASQEVLSGVWLSNTGPPPSISPTYVPIP